MGNYIIISVRKKSNVFIATIKDLDGVSVEHSNKNIAIGAVKELFHSKIISLSQSNEVPPKYTKDFYFVEHNK